MKCKYKRKSKKQRQNWWNSLNQEQQEYFIKHWQENKAVKRYKKSQAIMRAMGLNFNCSKCIHGKTLSCRDRPKSGCIYFCDIEQDIWGPAYRKTG